MTHTRFTTFSASVAAVLLAVLLVAGCGSSSAAPADPTTKDGRPATLGVADEDLGRILVDSQAHTLYLFQKDSGTTSTCTGACASNWPPLRANGTPTVGSGANASMVGTTARSDGKPQVTYNGHPLYLFVNDQKCRRRKRRGPERVWRATGTPYLRRGTWSRARRRTRMAATGTRRVWRKRHSASFAALLALVRLQRQLDDDERPFA